MDSSSSSKVQKGTSKTTNKPTQKKEFPFYDSIERRRMSADESSSANGGGSRQAKWEETILFFLSAVGCTLGWTSVLSNLVYYTDTLGVDSYVYLNLCIYAPLFPITIAQSLWDADFDRQFSSLNSFWVRGSFGFAVTLISTILLASGSQKESLWSVSLLSLLLGTSSGILHGALKQMASFVYPGCGRLAAAVTAGLQASAVFVLVVTLLTPGSTTTSNHWLHCFYGTIAVLVGACWLGFQRLMTHSRDVYRSMLRRDSSIQLSSLGGMSSGSDDEEEEDDDEEEANSTEYHSAEDVLLTPTVTQSRSTDSEDSLEPLLPPNNAADESEHTHLCANQSNHNTNSSRNSDTRPNPWLSPTMKHLVRQSWPLCVAIFLTVASSMAVASWFNRVPSDHHPDMLPQVLFYTRLFADLLARPATLLLPSNNSSSNNNSADNQHTLWYLLGLVGLRLVFVPYFFLYTTSPSFPRSDLAMTLGVFGFAFSSGFVTTWVYQLAPRYCKAMTTATNASTSEQESLLRQQPPQQPAEGDAVLLLQQTNLLNVCFSASVLLGLIGSLSLAGMKMSDDTTS